MPQTRRKDDEPLTFYGVLKANWPQFTWVFTVAGSLAYGGYVWAQTTDKVKKIEDVIIEHKIQAAAISEAKQSIAVHTEQLRNLQETATDTNKMIRAILQSNLKAQAILKEDGAKMGAASR